MGVFDDLDVLSRHFKGWQDDYIHPNSPSGGGGPGGLRSPGPAGTNICYRVPHPDSPAGRYLTATEIASVMNKKAEPENVKIFEEGKKYDLAVPITWLDRDGKTSHSVTQVTGSDLNYAVCAVFAEAGGLNQGTANERKAMADMLTNRIGAAGMGRLIPRTYTEVIQYPGQFESYLGEKGKSPKFLKGEKPLELQGNSVKEWNLAYDAMATDVKGGSGPVYPYTSNRSAKSSSTAGWTVIGASRFRLDTSGWKWKKRGDGSMGWDWEGIGRITAARPTGKPKE